jgi:hypothetical protein
MESHLALDMIQGRLDNATDPEERERLVAIAASLERGWTIRQDALERLTVSAAPKASMQSWRETIYATIADGTAVTAAAKTLLVPDFTLPANFLYPGRVLKYTLYGRMSTVITTPGTWTHTLNWGGSGGTVLASTTALGPDPTAASTNIGWTCEYLMVCRSTGTAGTAFTMGKQWHNDIDDGAAAVANLTAALNTQVFPDAPAAVSIDTTTAKAITPAITPSVATGSITAHIAILEALS